TPILVLQAAYNDVFTGSPTRFPFALWSPTDRLGFGMRGLDPGGVPQIAFHVRQGIAGVLANVGQLDEWAYGGFVLLGVAVAGLVLVRRQPAVWAVAAVGAAIPLGYVFFWGVANGGNLWDSFGRFGPFYFVPALVPLAIFGAEAIVTIWASRPRIGLCAVIVMTLIGGIGAVTAVSASVTERNARQQPYDLIANRLGGSSKALVLLPGYYVGNTLPGIYSLSVDSRTRVLYAVSQGNVDVDLVRRFKDHVPYRLVGCSYSVRGVLGTRRLPTGTDAPFPRVDGKGARLERLKVWHGSTVHLELTVAPTAHAQAMLTVLADGRPISMRLPL